MTSSAQLEREAEQTRSQLAQTLDELRERITPGQLVDQAFDYAKDSGGADFVRNLGRQMAGNPLPVMLIGTGMAWLMLSGRGRSARADSGPTRSASAAMSDAGDRAARLAESTADAAPDAGQRMGQAASSLGEGASSLYESARSRTTDAYGRISDTATGASAAMTDSVAGMSRRALDTSTDFVAFCKAHPLMLAGLGVTLGAILAASIPPTEAEDRLMGQTSDQLKDQAREAAKDQYEKAKEALASGVEEGREKVGSGEMPGAPFAETSEAGLVPEQEGEASEHTAEQH